MSAIEIYPIDDDNIRFTFQNGTLDIVVRCGDITIEHCDAIVNPTGTSMSPDGGLDNHVHYAMGQFFTDQVVAIHRDKMSDACPIGQSRIFISKSEPNEKDPRYVINTVGPMYSETEKRKSIFLLKSCYYTSLALANLYQLNSIAYPAISCGLKKFPPHEAAQVAIESIREFSHNVKDIRFILFERSTYCAFVEEWSNYAERVNNQVQGVFNPIKTDRKVSSSEELCILCKQNAIAKSQSHQCSQCSNLNRATLFENILNELRRAAEKSFDQLLAECQKLKELLGSYRISYDPVQYFKQNMHVRDTVAEHYVQNHCDQEMRSCIPLAIVGDGNCFYNTFVALAGITGNIETTITAVELRTRNLIELVLNRNAYKQKYYHLLGLCDPLEDYVVSEMVKDSSYVANWDFFSMPTVLNIHIISIYPRVNGNEDTYQKSLNNVRFTPLTSETKDSDASSNNKEVRILFSNMNRPVKNKEWMPNHFVPLLRLS